jgi:hypothetical protein
VRKKSLSLPTRIDLLRLLLHYYADPTVPNIGHATDPPRRLYQALRAIRELDASAADILVFALDDVLSALLHPSGTGRAMPLHKRNARSKNRPQEIVTRYHQLKREHGKPGLKFYASTIAIERGEKNVKAVQLVLTREKKRSTLSRMLSALR